MKIALDIRSLAWTKERTGIEEYIYQLACLLPRKAKNDQFIFFYNSKKELGHLKKLGDPSNVSLINLRKNNRLLNLQFALLKQPKIDKLLKAKPDLVIIPSYRPAPFSKEVKTITIFHDLAFEYFPKFSSLRLRIWHKYVNIAGQAKDSDHIIAVSSSTKNDIINLYGIPKEKITVIHHGIDRNDNNMDNSKIINGNDKFIFTLGTIGPRKNITSLIKAFKLLKKETKLPHKLIVGGKKESMSDRKTKILDDKDIILTGYLKPAEKNILYKQADVFALPSCYEGFGLPVLEAMSYGTPVIASNVSALPEVTKNNAILVNPYNILEIKEALKNLLESKELRNQFGKMGFERSKQFNWEKCIGKTLKIIRSVEC